MTAPKPEIGQVKKQADEMLEKMGSKLPQKQASLIEEAVSKIVVEGELPKDALGGTC